MAQKKIIAFNGPPNSGKDLSATIVGSYLRSKPGISVMQCKFADPLKLATHTLFAIPHSTAYYEAEFGNAWKNTPQPEFFGHTPREVYIAISEEIGKRFGGPAVFGRVQLRKIKRETVANTFVFSDCGFFDEIVPLITEFGKENCLVIELRRPGTSFADDSRGYIGDSVRTDPRTKGTVVRTIHNDDDRDLLNIQVKGAVKSFLKLEE